MDEGREMRGQSWGRLWRKAQERDQDRSHWKEGVVGWVRAAGIQEDESINITTTLGHVEATLEGYLDTRRLGEPGRAEQMRKGRDQTAMRGRL